MVQKEEETLKEACKKGSKKTLYHEGWPLCNNNRIIIHLQPPNLSHLRNGDCYFCNIRVSQCTAQLVLRHMRNGKIQEYAILEGDYQKFFTMDLLPSVNSDNPLDLATLMAQCLIAAEHGIQRMGWESMTLSAFKHPDKTSIESQGYKQNVRPRFLPEISNTDITHQYNKEARAVHRVAPDGTRLKEEPPPPDVHIINTPVHITDIHTEVLHSGAAIFTGCLDSRGGTVIVIFCQHPAWQLEHFNSEELAKLLLYYYSIPREEVQHKGMTLVVDARGTTLPVLNALLQTLYNVQASLPGAMFIVHVLADRVAQSLLFRSSVFRPQVNLKIDLLMTIDALYKFIDRSHLPPQLGGTRSHTHGRWTQFRLKLDQFLGRCRTAATFLVSVMQEMASIEGMPSSLEETQHLIEEHQQYIQQAFDDSLLREVHQGGLEALHQLSVDLAQIQHDDCRDSLDQANTLYTQVKETITRLVKLAEERLQRLEMCLQLRQFEEHSSQVINWICTQGEEILSQHRNVSDNLKGIRTQKKEFDKQYFSAMTQIEKGNDMLEEASLLTQSGNFDEVTGIKDVSKELKARTQHFSSHLEELREKIEDTSKCYHLLDRSYEWALDAMKHVAGMKMDKDMAINDITKLLVSLDLYLKEHPAIGKDMFQNMQDLAKKLGNEKLIEQCSVAQARCIETSQLLKVRQVSLQKAKDKMETEQLQQRRCSYNVAPGAGDLTGVVRRGQETGPLWEPKKCSTPLDSVVRRRSYAGKPSAPIYSPTAAAFKDYLREMNLFEYEEYLFNEGLITEDMSDRIVAFLPKGLSDSTLRGSRESLRASTENLQQMGSSENLARDQKSNSLPRELPGENSQATPSGETCSPSSTTLNKHSRPHRKMLKKASSCLMETENSASHERRFIKTISMISGSTESLPSMPEEEEEVAESNPVQKESRERKFGWSPVPVNAHLLYKNHRSVPAHHQSMADIRVAEEDIKRRQTLAWITREMIQTERDYVRSLQLIIENYLPEMFRDDLPQPLRGKRNIIFGNLEKIYEFHSQYFLAELEQCENNPYQLSHCFLQHDTEFYLYALYNKNKPKSDILMQELGALFFRKKQIELGDRMDLSSYLLKPVQRMGKYALLLKQIIKECPETEPEYHDLKAAHEMVKFQLRHGNDLLAMDCLRDCDVNLQEQGMLLRQDRFLVYNGRKKCLRHVFLFEEMVIFSKTKRKSSGHDVYVYKNSIKTSDMGMTETMMDSPYKFELWFRRRTAGETFILQTPDLAVKNAWTREISRLLWKQAIRNREMRLNEMARMGIGSKPCVDLKPSKDNINDRFVNISLSSRVPRTRNSIAVSSFDHLKNSNKRPHSLISITSSSSSSSNQSSSYGSSAQYGASFCQSPLGVTVESPLEDEQGTSNNKAYTLSSTESGIVEDINSAGTSPTIEACDAFTQTTLKRPGKKRDGRNSDEVVHFSIGSDPDSPQCTDV